MKNLTSRLKYFYLFSACILVFSLASCQNKVSSNYSEQSFSNGGESKEILAAVQGYWSTSLEGNKENLSKFIRKAPDGFWKACPSKDGSESKANEVSSGVVYPRGEGKGISDSEKDDAYWMLEYFFEQIQNAKPELLKANILKSNANEAVVKFDYRKANSKEAGFVSKIFLLYKENSTWKIFMITNSLELSRYNKIFASSDKCT